jgi:hypothetical protein
MYPTRHAVQRYQQRVEAVSTAEAFRTLAGLSEHARVRATPRWWTPVKPAPGLLFAYPASRPGVCLLLRGGAILTVFERSQCRRWAAAETAVAAASELRPRCGTYHRPPAGARLWEAA